jgi:hypothetical protein
LFEFILLQKSNFWSPPAKPGDYRRYLFLFLDGFSASLFGQQPNNSEVVGTWTHEGGLVYRFNADGTFSMSVEGEKAKQDAQSVQDRIGKMVSARTQGTYTVTQGSINMIVMVNKKSRRMRMAYRKIDYTVWFNTKFL